MKILQVTGTKPVTFCPSFSFQRGKGGTMASSAKKNIDHRTVKVKINVGKCFNLGSEKLKILSWVKLKLE